MDDERLEAMARRLGDDGERRVDPDRVVDRVLHRLRSQPVEASRPSRRAGRSWIRIAAAAALVAAAGLGIRSQLGDRSVVRGEALAPQPGLAELVTAELAEVMDSLEVEAPVAELVVGLDDLSEEQLEMLLRRLEG